MVFLNVICAEHVYSILGSGRPHHDRVFWSLPLKPLKDAKNTFEKRYILECLKAHSGNITKPPNLILNGRICIKIRLYGLEDGK